jgi:amino acid permease
MIVEDGALYAALGGGGDKANGPGASVAASVANLSAAILGAGILSLPAAFAQAGYATTLALLGASGAVSWFTMHLLTVVSREVGGSDASFYIVAQRAIPRQAWMVEAAVIVSCFGLGTAYLVAFGETMPLVVSPSGHAHSSGAWLINPYLWVAVGAAVAAPLAFARSMDNLRFTSSGGMVAAVFLAAVALYYFFQPNGAVCPRPDDDDQNDQNDQNDDESWKAPHCGGSFHAAVASGPGILRTLSLVVFSFTAHIQLLSVCNEVALPYRQRRMDAICGGAVGLCALLYAVVGFCGYAVYGGGVSANLLLSYPGDPLVTAARVGISGLVVISYPLMAKPCRDSVLSLLAHASGDERLARFAGSRGGFLLASAAFVGGTFGAAMGLVSNPDALGLILSFVGATCAVLVVFIIPPVVYATVFPQPHPKRTLAQAIACLGALLVPVCVASIFV